MKPPDHAPPPGAGLPPKVHEFLCQLDEQEIAMLRWFLQLMLGGRTWGRILLYLLSAPFVAAGVIWGGMEAVAKIIAMLKGWR